MRLLFFISLLLSTYLFAQENPTIPKSDSLNNQPTESNTVSSYATDGLDKDEPNQSDAYEYFAIKFNYGLRPVRRDRSVISINIDSSSNEFMTTIKDTFNLSYINDLKGFSFGMEFGFDNRLFMDYMVDFISRTRGYNTNSVTLEGNVGYNFKIMPKQLVFIRPSLGVFYSRLNTVLGNYQSWSYYYQDIEVKQSSTLIGIRPRLQIELPIYHIEGAGIVFVRFEVGYNASAYLSRFIKLRAQTSQQNSRGNYPYDADRYYLDGDKSGYLYNNKHINQTPTQMGGHFLGVELGIKFGD